MTDVPAGGVDAGEVAEHDPLLDELAALFDRVDPVPAHVMAAAGAAIEVVTAWRDLDSIDYGGLLDVVTDTALPAELVGVRTDGGPRLVTFGADGGDRCVEVELGVEPAGTLRLVGLVVPTGPDELEVRSPGGAFRVPVDELGRFRAAGVPAGPLSLVLHYPGQQGIPTNWITV